VPPIDATGGLEISCRKLIRIASASSVLREVHVLTSRLAVAQMRSRSSDPWFSSRSTWMLGGKSQGQFFTSAINA
jgi:hypothetical protein